MSRARKQIHEIIDIKLDFKTGRIDIFCDCLTIGACPTQIYLEFQRLCREQGIEITPLPGKGPFDFSTAKRSSRKPQK